MNSLLFCVMMVGATGEVCLKSNDLKLFINMNPTKEFIIKVKKEDV